MLGYDPLQIGLAFLPATLIMGLLSFRFAEPVVMRFGARRALIAGMALVVAGLALFTRAPVNGDYAQHVLPVMLVLGLGIGVCFPALMTLAMSGATREDAGLASGLVNTTAQVGGALGLAVLATLAASRSDDLLVDGTARLAALTSGYHRAFLVGALLVAAAVAVAAKVLRDEGADAAAAQGAGEPAYSEAGC